MKQPLTNILDRLRNKLKELAPESDSGTPGNQPDGPASLLPLGPITFTSGYYFMQAKRLWVLLLYSVPLDLIFWWVRSQSVPVDNPALAELCTGILGVVVLLCTLALFRRNIVKALLAFDKLQTRVSKLSSLHIMVALGVIALIIFFEAALKFRHIDAPAIIAALIVTVVAIRAIRKTLAEHRRAREQLSENRSLWVEKTNYSIFIFNIVPLLAARAVSLCGGGLLLSGAISTVSFLMFILGSEVLLIYFEPDRSHFQTCCKRCAQRTSLALLGDGLCPLCAQRR